jgi:hypothetical protein
MAFAAQLLLVFSLVLITIGVVAALRLRRHGRAPAPVGKPDFRARSAESRDYALPAPAQEYEAAPGAPGYDAPGAGYESARSTTLYPGGMDAEAAEIERLNAELAELKAHGGDGSFRRTQALVAVAANVSGVLGLFVSVAALLK